MQEEHIKSINTDISEAKKFAFIILIILITDIAILLDIPFIRQVIGFLFLTLLPGLLILQILKLNKIGSTEKFVLSVGLSISFLMFFGLGINSLSLSLGYEKPLSTIFLLISFNVAFIILAIIGYKRNKNSVFAKPNLNLSRSEKAFLIVPLFFPALSIFGMRVMNMTDNNTILMFLLFLIPIYSAFICFINHKFPKRLYPMVIFLISISLLLLLPLRSNHLIGSDTHLAYLFFLSTLNNLHWSFGGTHLLDACLSISLLPAIYQSILNVSPEFLFKILHSVIYSISPLVIYVLSKRYIVESYAFMASFFFMSQHYFLYTAVHSRANTAILFVALAMMILLSDKIDPLKKRILFIIFMVSCIISHYSTAYLFFFIMLGAFVIEQVLSKKYTFKNIISVTIVLMFFAFIFFWYSQVTKAAFSSGVQFVDETVRNLNSFFIEESKSKDIQLVLGEGVVELGIPQQIEFVLSWLTFVLIAIGIITLIRRYKEMSFPELNFKKSDILKNKFDVVYFVLALTCSGLLIAMVAIPFRGYGICRAYPITIIILSLFFVIGGIVIAKYLNQFIAFLKGKVLIRKSLYGKFATQQSLGKLDQKASQVLAYLIILLVLIPYFLCTTGVMCNIFGNPREIILNSEGSRYDWAYVHDQESNSAKWLERNEDQGNEVYVGSINTGVIFISQAKISSDIRRIEHNKKIDGYIYLGYYNVIDNKLISCGGVVHNMTEYSDIFVGKNRIYDNGGSEIWN